jgi:uncharacterized membrane protein YebE (DUF533 family)
MNFTDLLGSLVQTGITPSTKERIRSSLGGGQGSLLDGLGNILGGMNPSAGTAGKESGLDQILKQFGRDLTPAHDGVRGGGLGNILEQLGGGAHGKKLATGGLGALVGAILGGGSGSMKGAVGGGLLALLGTMAMQALKNAGHSNLQAPVGLIEPQNNVEAQEENDHAKLILLAMINAAKADGAIDDKELQRILGQLQDDGADQEVRDFLLQEMQKPIQTGAIVAAVAGRPELAAQIYAASLLAIEVDTPQERQYLDQLAESMQLDEVVTRDIEAMFAVQ